MPRTTRRRKSPAEAERRIATRLNYRLPPGWTWERIAEGRARYGHAARMFPVASAGGVTAWGVPLYWPPKNALPFIALELCAARRRAGDLTAAIIELRFARALRLVGQQHGEAAEAAKAALDPLTRRIANRDFRRRNDEPEAGR